MSETGTELIYSKGVVAGKIKILRRLINEIKTLSEEIRMKIRSGEFSGVDEELTKLESRIEQLTTMLQDIEESFLDFIDMKMKSPSISGDRR